MRRFFRDAGILFAFCGAFYLLIVMVGRIEGDSQLDANEFSPIRKRADKFVEKKDWGSAIKEYGKLTELDPYNGHAWNRLASLVLQTRRDAIYELGALDDNQLATYGASDIAKRIDKSSNQAHDALIHLSKFARYRPDALLQMAVIECYRNNHDMALDHLEEFVSRGYTTDLGLSSYSSFGEGRETEVWIATRVPPNVRLHQYKRFWSLVHRERESRSEFQFHSIDRMYLPELDRNSWGFGFQPRR